MKRFAFILDPLTSLDLPGDTSYALIRECVRRGMEAYAFTLPSLALVENQVWGKGRRLIPQNPQRCGEGPLESLCLKDFDAVLVRKDPPFDDHYLAMTYLLEPLTPHLPVWNDPRGIRNANEKIFGARLEAWSPASLLTADVEMILHFQEKHDQDLVIKPLYDKGGKGIFLLQKKNKNRRAQVKEATGDGTRPVFIQTFVPDFQQAGDKRIFIWKGEILGAFGRIPCPGEFRANLSLGGRQVVCEVSASEKKLVRELAPLLEKEHLSFTGIDVRGGKLIEVNVTCPAGLVELDQVTGKNYTGRLVDKMLQALPSKSPSGLRS